MAETADSEHELPSFQSFAWSAKAPLLLYGAIVIACWNLGKIIWAKLPPDVKLSVSDVLESAWGLAAQLVLVLVLGAGLWVIASYSAWKKLKTYRSSLTIQHDGVIERLEASIKRNEADPAMKTARRLRNLTRYEIGEGRTVTSGEFFLAFAHEFAMPTSQRDLEDLIAFRMLGDARLMTVDRISLVWSMLLELKSAGTIEDVIYPVDAIDEEGFPANLSDDFRLTDYGRKVLDALSVIRDEELERAKVKS